MDIEVYNPNLKTEWDQFIYCSKNATFLHFRDFIEYHGERFTDFSLMFYSNRKKLTAVLPGHIEASTFYSHLGLTYGGLIMDENTKCNEVVSIFGLLLDFLAGKGIERIIYKPVPHIYHIIPAEEDLYALFLRNAILTGRKVSSTLLISDRPQYSTLRQRGIKKAQKEGLKVEQTMKFELFWDILTKNLQLKYNAVPVHSLAEINYLRSKFPENIKLYIATDHDNELRAGCVIFSTSQVDHVQYIAADEKGKELGAIDLLVDYIINHTEKRYFDYGTSTEGTGCDLNATLIHQKEGFGTRATIYDTYTIELK